MASIASKNLYELLGNDPDQDPELRQPEPPTKAIEKPLPRSGKRDVGPVAPSSSGSASRGGGRGRGRGDYSGNERAFRDGASNREQNRTRNPDELGANNDRPARADGYNRGRGRGGRGRGGRGGFRDDRHSHTGISDHPKQVAHGWGAETGTAELADERAGEAIAKSEEVEGWGTAATAPENADGEKWVADGGAADSEEPAEPEVRSKSYEEYLAELAEKKLQLGGGPATRKANEGASKKFPEGKAFSREEQEFFVGTGGKSSRIREKKEKQVVDISSIDPRSYLAEDRQASSGGRGGRGRGRGDREDRGGRGGGRGRGDRGDRGGFRGGDRSEFRGRGGRGGAGGPPRTDDNQAFPTLGA